MSSYNVYRHFSCRRPKIQLPCAFFFVSFVLLICCMRFLIIGFCHICHKRWYVLLFRLFLVVNNIDCKKLIIIITVIIIAMIFSCTVVSLVKAASCYKLFISVFLLSYQITLVVIVTSKSKFGYATMYIFCCMLFVKRCFVPVKACSSNCIVSCSLLTKTGCRIKLLLLGYVCTCDGHMFCLCVCTVY